MDSAIGRPSSPPEPLRRAWLRPALDPVRSERWLRAEIDDRVLYRWFVGPGMDAPIGSPTTVSKHRKRLLASDVASAFFDAVVTQARAAGLLSDEHVTVARTQLDAWASRKSVPRPEAPRPPPDDPGNPTVHVHGARRSQATPRSTTDPDAPLVRQGGAGAVCSALGHVVLDHRHGLVVTPCVTAATGAAASAGYAARG